MTQAAPTIASTSSALGSQGVTLDVVITGSDFTEATGINFGDSITVNSFSVDSAAQITANITIDADAITGSRDVSVSTPGGTVTMSGGFTVAQVNQQEDNGDNSSLGEEPAGNSETGGCSCDSASGSVSAKELAIGWGIVGICWGGGYYLVRKRYRQTIDK